MTIDLKLLTSILLAAAAAASIVACGYERTLRIRAQRDLQKRERDIKAMEDMVREAETLRQALEAQKERMQPMIQMIPGRWSTWRTGQEMYG